MLRHTRPTTVVSHAPRFSIASALGAAQPQPRLLEGVVGLAQRTQHPVRDRPQAGAVLVEALGQPFLLAHVTFLRGVGSQR